MNLLLLLRAFTRAWQVVTLCAAGTCAAFFVAWSTPGVYYAQADVIFLRPVNRDVPNALSVSSSSVIATAGVIERLVNVGPESPRVTSTDVSLVSEGVRRGTSVQLPNSGGQWANNFDQPKLHVQVVDSTPELAQDRLDRITAQIDELLRERQAASQAAPDTWMRTQLSPAAPQVVHMAGDRRRAGLAVLFLGGGATCAAVILLESRRRGSPPPAGSSPSGPSSVSDLQPQDVQS